MSIVLKENEWAEQMIKCRSLGKKPSETLRRVCRYYIDNGCVEKELLPRLEVFLIRCDPMVSLPKWHNTLVNIIKASQKFKAVDIDSIKIYNAELDVIESLDSAPKRRLAFSLLCLAKYWNIVRNVDDGWVNSKTNEIMAMANISASLVRQGAMFRSLRDEGLIQFSKKVDNTNVKVDFINETGDIAIEIDDFRNLGYQYAMYYGGPYMKCQNCGVVTRIKNPKNNRGQKYCPDCAVKVRTQQNVDSVMRIRESTRVSENA